MRIRIVETMEKWNELKATLVEKGYKLFQLQYSAKQSEGLHAWFIKGSDKRVEVMTHNVDIEQDIIMSKLV